jgi:hypothetical protein
MIEDYSSGSVVEVQVQLLAPHLNVISGDCSKYPTRISFAHRRIVVRTFDDKLSTREALQYPRPRVTASSSRADHVHPPC